eukprot:SAG22_NODE_14675_length_368_cov_0.806691_1_plen_53_part_10
MNSHCWESTREISASIWSTSCEKRLRMRPVGVVSKNETGSLQKGASSCQTGGK